MTINFNLIYAFFIAAILLFVTAQAFAMPTACYSTCYGNVCRSTCD